MNGQTPSALIVVGLGWGDEGKGATVDALAARHPADRVVRFNGGQQAAHNVVAGKVHHTFANFGSAGLSGVPTWVAGDCTVEPSAAWAERLALRSLGVDPDLFVVEDCLVTTALHVAANRAREAARGAGRHGSTGRGFGETIAYGLDQPEWAPRARDLAEPAAFLAKGERLLAHYGEQGVLDPEGFDRAELRAALERQCADAAAGLRLVSADRLLEEIGAGRTIFEGAQGFWLDQNFGFQPHTTWSTTTPAPARRLCRQAGIGDVTAIGCVRTYATRHGAGPLPAEGAMPPGRVPSDDPGARTYRPPEPHNGDAAFAGVFRVAPHDPAYLRAAIDQTMVDVLAVNHLDVYDHFATTSGPMPLDSFGPVLVRAAGPDRADRQFTGI
ncbi:MAG: adenylosuccinate synthetase [Bifidobacteriaceae bacterium]|jgi:adenylosuccinate synthase|nr:adenylosuccinate synthetase [Bifidobacteriaceae bacterium]